MPSEIEMVARAADTKLNLAQAKLDPEFFYMSLPLCVIDAVFSIGVNYSGVRKAVKRYCDTYGLQEYRIPQLELPPISDQESITSFCMKAEEAGPQKMAQEVFCNSQRTSSRGGILKAQAVLEFAKVLRGFGIDNFQDIAKANYLGEIASEVRRIKGQKSGISLKYFWMLAGDQDLIKPDRMILGFLKSALGHEVTESGAEGILRGATAILRTTYPHLTPRLLDNTMWNYQRSQ
jgi:hypothetical protein